MRTVVEEDSLRTQFGLGECVRGGKTMEVELMNDAFNTVGCEEGIHYSYFDNFQIDTSINLAHFISHIQLSLTIRE